MFGLPLELITMIVSYIASAYIRLQADKRQDLADERLAREGALKEARAFQTTNANWARRFLVVSFVAMAGFILIAPAMWNTSTQVPIEYVEGFKFWFLDFTKTVTRYVELEGVVTPDYLPHAIMAVVGFYFGNSNAKR